MHYDIFRSITRLQTVLLLRYTASTNSSYYSILYLYTQTNHVCDFITLNYASMTHWVGIYSGTVAFYRDQTRVTVSDITSEWI